MECKCVFILPDNPLLKKKDLSGAFFLFVYLTPKHLQRYLQLKFQFWDIQFLPCT